MSNRELAKYLIDQIPESKLYYILAYLQGAAIPEEVSNKETINTMEAAKLNTYTKEDYYNTPEDMRVELINGQFYNLASPSRIHQELLMELAGTIRDYIKSNGGSCKVYPTPFAVKPDKDKDNIVEPDISVICDPGKLTDKGCTGAPDWIIEIISPITASHDFVRKLNLYGTAGVKEYWIVDPQNQVVFVHILKDGVYSNQNYEFSDKVKASIYDDLYIDFKELPTA